MLSTNEETKKSTKVLLQKLRDVEIALGNLREPDNDMQTRTLKTLVSYLDSSDKELSQEDLSDGMAEMIFSQIVNILSAAGETSADIADIINEALRPYASMPYCNEMEVQQALRQ